MTNNKKNNDIIATAFKIISGSSGIIAICLMLGAFSGLRLLCTNVIKFRIIARFGNSSNCEIYLFDLFYLIFMWGALVFIIRHIPDLLQAPAMAVVMALPIVMHILISEYGPWYAEDGMMAIVLYVVFSGIFVPGLAYTNIKDYIDKRKKPEL